MNEPPKQPRYFRLLEKGEIIKEGDYRAVGSVSLEPRTRAIGDEYTRQDITCRPIICDEWVSFAERKPTKEDFEPTGYIELYNRDAVIPFYLENKKYHFEYGTAAGNLGQLSHWRRVTPPEQPKPKSATIRLRDTGGCEVVKPIVVHADGHVTLSCGDTLSAESIDEFIKQRNKVMQKDL